MTCIVSVWDGRKVWMGADSAATEARSMDRWTLGSPKVIRKGKFLYGLAGDPTIMQAIRSSFDPEPRSSGFDYISGLFVESLQQLIESKHLMHGAFMPAHLLVGFQGESYAIMENFFVIKSAKRYAAIGSGATYALGSLANSKGSARKRMETALKSACEHNAGCAPPFNYVQL